MSKLMTFLTIACLLIFPSIGLFAYWSDVFCVTFPTTQVTGTPVVNLLKNRDGGCISICKFFFKFLYIWSVP